MAWESLPTDYTDAVWSGLKKYTEVTNDDGTISFQDVTQYSNKEKSFFGAKDANKMNGAINTLMGTVKSTRTIQISVPASGWSSSAPYTQEISVSSVTANDDFGSPEIKLSGDADADRTKMVQMSYICGGVTSAGKITLYCYDNKPSVDLTLLLTQRNIMN